MTNRRLRILFLTPQLPYPPHQGTSIRNYNLIKQMSHRHSIDLVTFMAPGDSLGSDSPLHDICDEVFTIEHPRRSTADRLVSTFSSIEPDMALRLHSEKMQNLLKNFDLHQYDIIQVEGIEMAPYGLIIKRHLPDAQPPFILFDDHNCEYLLQKRNALTDLRTPKRWLAALYSLIQWQKLRRYEKKVCLRADTVVAVSEPDRQALVDLTDNHGISLVPNGVDSQEYVNIRADSVRTEAQTIVFTGKMDYRPNIDAVLWFVNKVWPTVLRHNPSARFQIVGQGTHKRLQSIQTTRGVEVTGFVPSVTPYLADATVFVIPMRIGGGTRLKALEAMAAGLPIVSTSLGIEGIPVADGRELFIRDESKAFADAISAILENEKTDGLRNREMGGKAQDFVQSTYDWKQIAPILHDVYEQLRVNQ